MGDLLQDVSGGRGHLSLVSMRDAICFPPTSPFAGLPASINFFNKALLWRSLLPSAKIPRPFPLFFLTRARHTARDFGGCPSYSLITF